MKRYTKKVLLEEIFLHQDSYGPAIDSKSGRVYVFVSNDDFYMSLLRELEEEGILIIHDDMMDVGIACVELTQLGESLYSLSRL